MNTRCIRCNCVVYSVSGRDDYSGVIWSGDGCNKFGGNAFTSGTQIVNIGQSSGITWTRGKGGGGGGCGGGGIVVA